jgi:hypothetical protein
MADYLCERRSREENTEESLTTSYSSLSAREAVSVQRGRTTLK